jgi:hypothetical protein
MLAYLDRIDALLRTGSRHRPLKLTAAPTLAEIVICIALCGMFYGAAMGMFGGFAGDRPWQMLFSAIKLPLLLLATFALCLPFFFVLHALCGLRQDFGAAVRKLLGSQAVLSIVLAAFTPLVLFWYASDDNYNRAILANACLLGTASLAAQIALARDYASLVARNVRHRSMLRVWLVLYAFVGIQMGWTLRPFIGTPGVPVEFFRADTWGNAYVIVTNLLWRQIFP